jgi:hypothetical protein
MQIVLYNTLPILNRYFTERTKPNELMPRYLEWAESEIGILSILREIKGRHGFQDFDILSAVKSDGVDLLEAQQQSDCLTRQGAWDRRNGVSMNRNGSTCTVGSRTRWGGLRGFFLLFCRSS